MRPRKRTLPVNLLLEGRRCLVVGGGSVALRKVNHLLDAGAEVVVVSPEVTPGLAELVAGGRVSHEVRVFAPDDVGGAALAFAATSEVDVNRSVLEACREQNVLCCVVDKRWTDGDFLTPATLRSADLTVAVATGGVSCRRSRMIKESLARHMDAVNTADIVVFGTSHERLSVGEREPFHMAGERLTHMAALLAHVWGVHEFVVLNTCNRIELHAVVADHEESRRLIEQILGFDTLAENEYYVHTGRDAFRHTAVLLAGLYSQVPGENHIVAQTKAAYADADRAGWGGSMMREWLGFALHTAKDIRRETQPMLRHAEIEDLCLDYVASECREQLDRGVLVLGCGLIGRGIVRRMGQRFPNTDVEWCYHETVPTLFNDRQRRVRLHALEDLPSLLSDAHLMICATGSPTHLLEAAHAELMDAEGTVTIVDLAMPRNVDPALSDPAAGIHVADLDDLKHWYRREAADMAKILEMADAVAHDHESLWQKLVKGVAGIA